MVQDTRVWPLVAFGLFATVTIASCGGEVGAPSASAQASPRVAGIVTQTASGCSLSLSSEKVKAGKVAFTFVNASGNKAGLDVWRMPQPSSFAELVAAAREDRRLAEAGEPPQGDHSSLGSAPSIRAEWDDATSRTVSGQLEAGTYALVCIATYPKVSEPRLLEVVGPIIVEPA